VLEGFIVTNGTGTPDTGGIVFNGGIFCCSSDPTIANNIDADRLFVAGPLGDL